MNDYELYDIVEMKKQHPCKKSFHWQIIRMVVDIKIKCLGWGAVIMMERPYFEKRLKKKVEKADKEK